MLQIMIHLVSHTEGKRSLRVFEVVVNQNYVQEEIKSRLKSGSACYHSVQNLLSSNLLSKNIKIKIYRAVILPMVLYGCEAWSVILREEHKLRGFENRVLRKMLGSKEVGGKRGVESTT